MAPDGRRALPDDRGRHVNGCVGVVRYLGIGGIPRTADVIGYDRTVNDDVSRVVVGNEEDSAAVLIDLVVLDARTANGQRHRVAVVVNRTAASTSRCARKRRVPAISYRVVAVEGAVDDRPGNADAADPAPVRTRVAQSLGSAELRVHDEDW